MSFSASNTELWSAILQFAIISVFMIFANILRRKIPIVNKSLLPVAVIAGFLLLFAKELNLIPVGGTFMESLTYHATGIGFIALGLRVPRKQELESESDTAKSFGLKSGMIIVSTYLLQACIGLVITIILGFTVMPNLFKACGILLPLGFGQGPGQAYNIGTSYQTLGFVGGSSFGLAIASMGFLWASIGGAMYMVSLVKRKKMVLKAREEHVGIVTSEMIEDRGEIPLTEAVDKFTVQIALVFAVYLATYLLSDGVSILLEKATFLGSFADTVITLIWGFNFLIGSSLALLLKFILSKLRKTKIMSHQYQNNYMLNRISGLAFDFMIVAGITSITLSDLADLWIPLLAITTVGGILTIVYLRFISKRIYRHYENEGFFAMYGMMTGTVSTGIMLLREIDPNFQTPAADNLILGSSTAILMGFPLLLMVGMAPNSTGTLFVIIGICIVYFLLLNYLMLHKKRSKSKG